MPRRCQIPGRNQVAAAATGLEPGTAYNRRHESVSNPELAAVSAPGIVVAGLRKRYGATLALDGMSFTVRPGRVTGFVGPNGAGKSTTMRVILGLDAVEEGTALIEGRPYHDLRHPLNHVGSLLDASALHPGRSARHHLLWLAHSQGLPARRVDQVIEQVGLTSAARRKAGGYSLGMRQRLGIAAALLGDPPVIMLDEPFNGMDPDGIIWMRGFLRSLAADGRAVLVSSHLMSEVQDTADHLVVVGCGRAIADSRRRRPDRGGLQGPGGPADHGRDARDEGAHEQPARPWRPCGRDTIAVSGLPADRIVTLLSESAVPFSEVAAHRASLEEVYLELTREAVEFPAATSGEVAR